MEYFKPPKENVLPPEEYSLPENEFYGQKPVRRADEDDRHRRLMRKLLMSLTATAGALSLMLASMGIDLFGTGDKSASATEAPSHTEAPAYTDAPAATDEPFTTHTPEPTPVPTPSPVPTEIPKGDWDDAFPSLDNLDPDFDGDYAWSGMGSEEYVTIIPSYDDKVTRFIVMGSVWGTMTNENGELNTETTVPGVSYDRSANTLTLTDFTGEFLDVNLMGNGFTIRLEGENRLGGISVWGAMYGGSLTITGPGSLVVDSGEYGTAILLNCEDSGSCLMIAGDATVELFGAYTVAVYDSLLDRGLYYLMPIEMIGGAMAETYNVGEGASHNYAALDEDGEPATHVIFRPKW